MTAGAWEAELPLRVNAWRSVVHRVNWRAHVADERVHVAQRAVEPLRLALEPLERLQVHVEHVDHLREVLRRAIGRGGRLPPVVDARDCGVERLAQCARLAIERLGELVCLLPLGRALGEGCRLGAYLRDGVGVATYGRISAAGTGSSISIGSDRPSVHPP